MVATIANRELFVPDGDKLRKKSTAVANAAAIELLRYGIQMDSEIVARISRQKQEVAAKICERILKMFTIGDVNPPLFSQWETRNEFTFDEFIIQILGYVFQISGNDLEDPSYLDRLKNHVDYKKTKTLKLADSNQAAAKFKRLVDSEVALDKETRRTLIDLAQTYHTVAPDCIRSDEARFAVLLGMTNSGLSLTDALQQLHAQPADVLRYAAGVLDFDGVKLPSDVLYVQLPWKERIELLKFLATFSFEDLCEAMGVNRQAWRRFLCHLHVLQQTDFRNRFAVVVAAAFVSRGSRQDSVPAGRLARYIESQKEFYDVTDSGNFAYRTFASRVQSAVEAKDFPRFRAEIEKRPAYLLRNMGSLSNVCTKKTEGEFVDLVRENMGRASAGVLFSIIQIDVNAEYRIIDSKGNTTVTEANYSPVIGEIQGVAEREIYRRYGVPGKVVVQEKLKTKIVPFLSTNADLDRGTRVPFEKSKYLYFLMHWVQQANRRTDLDHSYVCFDDQWNSETIFFGNQANSFIAQSGDITNAPAPHGGTEYGRIDLQHIPKNVCYIVPIMNVYCGDVFSENETAYAGFMFTDAAEFLISRKHTRFDLTQPANSNIPFVMDVKNQEIVIVDFNNRRRDGLTAHSSIGEMRKIISAVKSKKFMTIDRFANILSGDESVTSLTITSSAKKKKNEIEPADLQSLIQ